MNLGQLLDVVEYGTKVRLVYSSLFKNIEDVFITAFVMSKELEYTKAFELVEPHLEKEVMAVCITSDGKLCVEIF